MFKDMLTSLIRLPNVHTQPRKSLLVSVHGRITERVSRRHRTTTSTVICSRHTCANVVLPSFAPRWPAWPRTRSQCRSRDPVRCAHREQLARPFLREPVREAQGGRHACSRRSRRRIRARRCRLPEGARWAAGGLVQAGSTLRSEHRRGRRGVRVE